MKPLDLTNQRFGKLVAKERVKSDKNGYAKWLCVCDCGNWVEVLCVNLVHHGTESCGCIPHGQPAGADHPKFVHGQSSSSPTHRASPAYKTWESMLRRCRNPKDKDYENYGGRGILVCESWSSFENFYKDVGDRPQGKTLDRKDVNGNYEPSNCQWATPLEQAQNRRPYKSLGKFSDEEIKEEHEKRFGKRDDGLSLKPVSELSVTL